MEKYVKHFVLIFSLTVFCIRAFSPPLRGALIIYEKQSRPAHYRAREVLLAALIDSRHNFCFFCFFLRGSNRVNCNLLSQGITGEMCLNKSAGRTEGDYIGSTHNRNVM